MKYYLAYSVIGKPFTRWEFVGEFENRAAFEASSLYPNPLIRPKSDIVYQFGVCTLYINSGILVQRTSTEMTVFENEYMIAKALEDDASRIKMVEKSYFTYDTNKFPMDEVSRLFYAAIEKTNPSSSKIRTMDDTVYDLDAADISAFMTAFYNQLLLISKHDV